MSYLQSVVDLFGCGFPPCAFEPLVFALNLLLVTGYRAWRSSISLSCFLCSQCLSANLCASALKSCFVCACYKEIFVTPNKFALNPQSSTYFDTHLTLSIPHNSLPLSIFHRTPLENFDTLSVYRGSLCEPVGRARTARSATRQRLNQRENSNNPEIQLSWCRKTSRSDSLHGFNAPTASGPSSLVKPGKVW